MFQAVEYYCGNTLERFSQEHIFHDIPGSSPGSVIFLIYVGDICCHVKTIIPLRQYYFLYFIKTKFKALHTQILSSPYLFVTYSKSSLQVTAVCLIILYQQKCQFFNVVFFILNACCFVFILISLIVANTKHPP